MSKQQKRARREPTPAPTTSRISRSVIIVAVVAVVIVVGGVVAIGAGGFGGSSATPSPVTFAGPPARDVTPQEAAARVAAGAILLDVREDSEWAAGHVPGATHIPLGELAARAGELPADTPIMVICRSGNRSQEGRDILLAAGLTQVASVNGGSKAWRDAGLPYDGQVI